MKRFVLSALWGILALGGLSAYRLQFAEEYYRLAHRHLIMYPEKCNENIFYLEQALKAPFCNPLYALAEIRDPREWERYRYLFYLHVNLKILEQYRILAGKYDKFTAFFYNYPWKEENLESLGFAEFLYNTAGFYWQEALGWAARLDETAYFHLPEVQYWEDEYRRIKTGDLNYREYLDADLTRLNRVRRDFEAMGPGTY
ncbi:MAG: hypothetical protein LBQ61_00010 [Spirochaetales bacterium]|jgi:hypothetical protein|nr:hypothetical protein [Spirochaetales bacterium]